MRIDPVVALMDELEAAYAALARARDAQDWQATRRELTCIAALHADLRETEPVSVIGAAHLLREAASLLLRSDAPYFGDRLREVAARFDEGARQFSDLVWLRSARQTLATGQCGRPGESAAALVTLALKGAARPVLLYRSIMPPASHRSEPAIRETRG